jgi:hypothetical protein
LVLNLGTPLTVRTDTLLDTGLEYAPTDPVQELLDLSP